MNSPSTDGAVVSINNWPDMLVLPSLAVSVSAFGAIWLVPGRADVAMGFVIGGFIVFTVTLTSTLTSLVTVLEADLFGLPWTDWAGKAAASAALSAVHRAHPESMRTVDQALLTGISAREYLRGIPVDVVTERARQQLGDVDLDHLIADARRAHTAISG